MAHPQLYTSDPHSLIAAIAKLIGLTQTGRLKWQSAATESDGLPAASTYRITTAVFTAEHAGTRLRIYRERRRPPFPSAVTALARTADRWTDVIVLEIIDGDGRRVWAFPEFDGLKDLMVAIEFRAADVDQFIKALLAEA
jgi:hypothetical protein